MLASGNRGDIDNIARFKENDMTYLKSSPARPVLHQCPVCQHPQTKIQRKLGEDRHGSTNFVCTRADCIVGINLGHVDTWSAV
jgi:hypothetical protein